MFDRITFAASDAGSGVHRLSYKLFVGNNTAEHNSGSILANIINVSKRTVISVYSIYIERLKKEALV